MKLPSLEWIRAVRADSEFFAKYSLQYLESIEIQHTVVARMQEWVSAGHELLRGTVPGEAFGERARRFVLAREQLRETRRSPGWNRRGSDK